MSQILMDQNLMTGSSVSSSEESYFEHGISASEGSDSNHGICTSGDSSDSKDFNFKS